MKQLHEYLQDLCREVGISNSELARRAKIDRPTLVHILAGRRTPTRENLEWLLLALEATPAQRREVLDRYELEKTDPALRRQRLCLTDALRQLFQLREDNPFAGVTPAAGGYILPEGEVCNLNSRGEIRRALYALLWNYSSGHDTQPLMIPPTLNMEWQRRTAEILAGMPGGGTVYQLSTFCKNATAESETLHNLDNISMALTFAHLPRVRYEAAFCYTQGHERIPGTLFAEYLLFPDCLLTFNSSGKRGAILRTPELLDILHRRYMQDFREAYAYLRMDTRKLDTVDTHLNIIANIPLEQNPIYMLRREPHLLDLLDDDLLEQFFTDAYNTDPIRTLFSHLHERYNAPIICFFAEAGLRSFAMTGRISDLPDAIYRPFSPIERRMLLQRLLEKCEMGNIQLYFVDDDELVPPTDLYLTASLHGGIHFYQRPSPTDSFQLIRFTEPSTVDAFLDFLQNLPYSGLTSSRDDVLNALRGWIDRLPTDAP